ncbi:MAG: pantothenate kinase, partial [Bacteroidales bacterium]|nr:pantothenate kinase [Bacteroidales bacterium]
VLYEIEQYIQQWRNETKNNIVILTGGDASFLENSIKNSIFADLNLVHLGLKRILDLNAE